MKYTTLNTPAGSVIITASEKAIHHIYFEDRIDIGVLEKKVGSLEFTREHPILQNAVMQLEQYLRGERIQFTLALEARGTEFQQSVWKALQKIPYGETWSYSDLAISLGKPTATRAVGAANGQNPISIVIPCHRVIGKNSTLTGYAGGIERKAWLLNLETTHHCVNSISEKGVV